MKISVVKERSEENHRKGTEKQNEVHRIKCELQRILSL